MTSSIAALRAHLEDAGAGAITDLGALSGRLAAAWPDLNGSGDTAMASWKVGRLETARWSPPLLSFTIERHGGTVLGSTRAEVQTWEADLDRHVAGVVYSTHRQLTKAAPRLDVRAVAVEVADLIEAGADDSRLKWMPDRSAVRVITSRAIPPHSGYKQTIQGRQRRFNEEWGAEMTARGWQPGGNGMWVRAAPAG